MKIIKYVKTNTNLYKVYIDDEVYKIYDDIISKYQLLFKDSINQDTLDNILKDNASLDGYYLAIKYINKRLRSKKEIKDYLKKHEYDDKIINEIIVKLESNRYIDDDRFLRAYLLDQINLSNNGPIKIKSDLIKYGIDEELIDDELSKIDSSIWDEKINDYIDKKIKCNHNSSSYMLKVKLKSNLINLGYSKEVINDILLSKCINDQDIYNMEYLKAKKSLEKKYSGYELERKIKERLYRKGFKVNNYED